MRLDKFLKLCLEKGKEFTKCKSNYRDGAYKSTNWSTYQRVAELTEHLDYGCQFTEFGCKQHFFKTKKAKKEAVEQMLEDPSHSYGVMCCCGGCGYAMGYLRELPNNLKALKEIAACYDERFGFWRLDKGCILPRKYRSDVCLIHRCASISPGITGLRVLEHLRMTESEIIDWYRRRSGKKRAYSARNAVAFLKKELLAEIETTQRRQK